MSAAEISLDDISYAMACACVALDVEPGKKLFDPNNDVLRYAAAALYRVRSRATWPMIMRLLHIPERRRHRWKIDYRAWRKADSSDHISEACARSIEQRRIVRVEEILAEVAKIDAQRAADREEAEEYIEARNSLAIPPTEPPAELKPRPLFAPVPEIGVTDVGEHMKRQTKRDFEGVDRMIYGKARSGSFKALIGVSVPFPGDKPEGWTPPKDAGLNAAARESGSTYVHPTRSRNRSITLPVVTAGEQYRNG